MKVYSRPEVLEDHIAPAALMTNNLTDTGISHIETESISTVDFTEPTIPTETLIIGGNDFDIQTVTLGTDGSPIANPPQIDFNEVLLQALIGNVTIGTQSSDVTFTQLADVVGVQSEITAAIESAVGEDRSASLVGLSSEEFERTGGSAFLTSL